MKTPRRNSPAAAEEKGNGKLATRFGQSAKGNRRRATDILASVSPIAFHDAVGAIIRDSDAIMFGSTTDGGALVITVFSGDERKKFYPDDDISARAAFEQIAEAYATDAERALRIVDRKKSG